ncbi:type II toxin-antitoxin system VapC family toxin [Candidatus Gottesmanbacteria bacterium]|nr:type II toxin-antitoxin system VapC family toxin [Candidatus Gottesmanbacteria bacterium]
MNIYIFDTSLVVAVILKENDRAASFVKKIERNVKNGKAKIVVPGFLLLELSNALRFKIIDKDKAERAFLSFFKIPVSLENFTVGQVKEIQGKAYEMGTTVYDTSYHYLAKMLDGVFITCDRNYFDKAKLWGNIKLV